MALAYIRHLPLDSAYVSAIRGTEYAGWDRQTYMTADLYDMLGYLIYLYQLSHAEKPKNVQQLPLYPRPGAEAEKPEKPTNPLLARLRGEDAPAPTLGPGSRIPLPPSRP